MDDGVVVVRKKGWRKSKPSREERSLDEGYCWYWASEKSSSKSVEWEWDSRRTSICVGVAKEGVGEWMGHYRVRFEGWMGMWASAGGRTA